jgi:hypothetical protein
MKELLLLLPLLVVSASATPCSSTQANQRSPDWEMPNSKNLV